MWVRKKEDFVGRIMFGKRYIRMNARHQHFRPPNLTKLKIIKITKNPHGGYNKKNISR